MKEGSTKSKTLKDADMRAEYDFSGGERGKYSKAYRQGHSVILHRTDGTTVVQNYTLEEGAVILDQDVRAYFPTAEAVNSALRALIALIPEKPAKPKAKAQRKKATSRASASI